MPRGHRPVGKNADPEFRHERARKARAAQNSPEAHVRAIEQRADELTPELAARIAAVVAPIVDRAPKLTAEQGAKLRAIFAEPAPSARRGEAKAA